VTNRPKNIGTAAETAVVRAARTAGFPHAERVVLHGSLDQGDIRLTPGLTAGIIVEVKGGEAARRASDAQIAAWLDETETERTNSHADIAFLVTQRAGIGAPNAHRWWAHLRVGHLAHLRGYPADLNLADEAPVRMTLASALAQLRAAGYGEPLDDTPSSTPAAGHLTETDTAA
jgi:hypothetical protein